MVAGKVLQSPNLCFTLGFRDQGNLVLVNKSGTVIWSSGTYNTFATKLYLNYGGDLKLLNSSGSPINWDTKTSGSFGFLRLQNDGNHVIYSDSFVPFCIQGHIMLLVVNLNNTVKKEFNSLVILKFIE